MIPGIRLFASGRQVIPSECTGGGGALLLRASSPCRRPVCYLLIAVSWRPPPPPPPVNFTCRSVRQLRAATPTPTPAPRVALEGGGTEQLRVVNIEAGREWDGIVN